MKRIIRTTSLAATGAALVLGAAGVASATGAWAGSGSHADAIAQGSPGVASGNVVQVPVHIPVNLCGNTVNVIGLLNPAFGNTCVNS